MERIRARFVGVELYFEDLERARKFYIETIGLEVYDEQAGHHAKFDSGAGFVCLERKGAESYPSKDKAVLFFELPDLRSAIAAIGTRSPGSVRRYMGCPARSRRSQRITSAEIELSVPGGPWTQS